jgi:hypothetical protein
MVAKEDTLDPSLNDHPSPHLFHINQNFYAPKSSPLTLPSPLGGEGAAVQGRTMAPDGKGEGKVKLKLSQAFL